MESPSKRLKLNTINDIRLSRLNPRLTQETRPTSTPQPSFYRSFESPNVSSIASSRSRSSRTRLTFIHEEESNASGSESSVSIRRKNREPSIPRSVASGVSEASSENYDGENYDDYFQQQKRFPRKGPVWKFYKPIENDTLYVKVLEDPANAMEVVHELLLSYHSEPNFVIKSMVKFCVDMAGFHHFDPTPYYNVKHYQESSKEIVNMMQSDELIKKHSVVTNSGKYLLMERNTNLVKHLRMGLYSFLQKLILLAHEKNILYDELFFPCFIIFIRNMVQSNVKCIRHAGVIISVKVLTAVILVYNSILNDSNYVEGNNFSGREESAILHERKNNLNYVIECLYMVYIKNCRLQDKTVYMMRVECIHEAKIWVKYFPKQFITDFQTAEYVIKLTTDGSKEVRLAALDACEALFGIPRVVDILKPIRADLTNAVAKRFYDVNIDIAVKALDIVTYLLQMDMDFISKDVFTQIGNLLFDQHASIGQAASKFMLAYFNLTSGTSEEILVCIATITCAKEGDRINELIVEDFLYTCDEMQNWKLFCKLILSEVIRDKTIKECLADLFSEAVHQRLSGESGINRTLSKKVIDVDILAHQQVAEVLGDLSIILSNQGNNKIIIAILKIILLVNTNLLERNFCKEYMDISNTIRILFNNLCDDDLLKTISEVMLHLCDVVDFAERGKNLAKIVCDENVEELQTFLEQPSGSGHRLAQKVAILFEHFNLNAHFSFRDLTDYIDEFDEKTTLHLLTCCKWYLLWSLRSLTENARRPQSPELNQILNGLSRNCNCFIVICFNLLQRLQKHEKATIQVYATMSDFCVLFAKELEIPIKLNREFDQLELKFKDAGMEKYLVQILEKYIISNVKMPLLERRLNVNRYINLVNYGIITVESLANIFRYYHKYNEEYGRIIEHVLTSISKYEDSNIIILVVVYTLMFVYKEILKKHGIVDVRSEEGVQLKLLAKQFATFKYFHQPKNLQKMLCRFLPYAFENEMTINFLYVVKYFVDLVDDDNHMKIVQTMFKQKIKKEMEKNDAVLFFSTALKITPLETDGEKKKIKAKPSRRSIKTTKPKKRPEKKPSKPSRSTKGTKEQSKPDLKTLKRKSEVLTTSTEDDISIHDSESDIDDSIRQLSI